MNQFTWPEKATLQRMLESAQSQGVVLRPAARFKSSMLASSASTTGVFYIVNEHCCTCPAGKLGRMCKHRALYIYQNAGKLLDKYGPPWWADQQCASWPCAA